MSNSKQTALDVFMAKKAEIDNALERLQELSDNHFDADPDSIGWGDAGTMGHYADLLKQITDTAFQEGEHATNQKG